MENEEGKIGQGFTSVDELEEVVNRGEKLPLPFIHYVAKAQEGRHRAVVAIRKKVPMKYHIELMLNLQHPILCLQMKLEQIH